jgi:hydrogenase/urease accessory protein HupE
MIRILSAIILCVPVLAANMSDAGAHALQPGYLELQLLGGDNWRVFWRKPTVQGKPMDIHARLPGNCDPRQPPEPRFDGAAWVSQWIAACSGDITGGEIVIEGLDRTQTDVLVRYQTAVGDSQTVRLTASEPRFVVPENPGPLAVLASYFALGVEHILDGIDHLLFVFALLLLIRNPWRLVGAITAFTIAHSLTLAAAALEWVVVPGPPVEAIIALSIMFLAVEILKRKEGQERLSERWPWAVSFSFGLLHGLGFAGALLEIGLPQKEVPLALLGFNLGVEAGQLVFVAAVLASGWCLARIMASVSQWLTRAGGPGIAALSYGIGAVSSYWFIDRVAGF